MATAKPKHRRREGPRPGPHRHHWRNGLLVLLVLGGLGLALSWHRLQARAVLAAAYGARIACTCHYIAGRGLKACRQDFEPGMALVMLDDNAGARSITASVPLIASQTAYFRSGAGCLLQSWAP